MDVEVVAAAAICLGRLYKYYKATKCIRKQRKRRWWMLAIHRNRTRHSMANQISELLVEPSGEFNNFVRMSFIDFEYLLQKIAPIVAKQDTPWRDSIPVQLRLAVTLRYLATGDSYRSLHYLFKISSQIISRIIPEVCLALNHALKELVKIPTSTEEWIEKAKEFKFPHCLGAIDGKHVSIKAPSHSASEYYNYKGGFSIVLLALVDHDYSFMFADIIGSQGRISDGGVFNSSVLWDKICKNNINIPCASTLPGSNVELPYVFLGDGAFALSTHIMKPFPGYHTLGSPERIFNQALSNSRVVVENTFGILTSVFRIFHRSIPLGVDKVSTLTMTCVLLHNYLRRSKTSRHIYTPPGSCDDYNCDGELVASGSWRDNNQPSPLLPLQPIARRSAGSALATRNNFMLYLMNKKNNNNTNMFYRCEARVPASNM